MNRLKRLAAGLLSALLIFGSVNFPALHAKAEGSLPTINIGISASNLTPQKEQTFTITVSTTGEASLINNMSELRLVLYYDATKFTYVDESIQPGRAWHNSITASSAAYPQQGYISYTLKTASSTPIVSISPGAIFKADFTVKATAINGKATFTSQGDAEKPFFEYYEMEGEPPVAVKKEITDYRDGVAEVTVSGATNPTLTGNVSISVLDDKALMFGETLLANVQGAQEAAQLQYQWYRNIDTQISGATNASYTLSAADVNTRMRVRVTAPGYNGSLIHTLSDAVAKAGEERVPDPPVIRTLGATQIVLYSVSGVEFARSSNNSIPLSGWQEGNLFDGLQPNTEYYFFARYKETPTHKAGAASGATLQKTTLTERQIKMSFDPLKGKQAYYYVQEGSDQSVKEGDKILLHAEPIEGFYFEKWVCGDLTGDHAIVNETSPTEAHFTMVAKNITIQALFQAKKTPAIQFRAPQDPSYVYTGERISLPLPHIANGIDLKDTDIELYYAKEGDAPPGEKTAPKDVGAYIVTAAFKGDAKNFPVQAATTMRITKATPNPPNLPEIKGFDFNSITFTTVSDQRYLVRLKSEPEPYIESRGWVSGTDAQYKWTGLSPATEYTIYTYTPEKPNFLTSYIRSVSANTQHTWKLSFKENGKQCTSLLFFAKESEASPDKTIVVQNDSDGMIKNLSVTLEGDNSSAFALDLNGMMSALAPKATTTFKLKAIGQSEGEYEAGIKISANKDAVLETGSIGSYTIPLSLIVSGKDPVTISGFYDDATIYNGQPQEIDHSNVAVMPKDEAALPLHSLIYTYKGYNGTIYTEKTTPPTAAGEYLVKVKVPDDNALYTGSDTAHFTIEKKELEIQGLEVVSRMYDGTTEAKLVGGALTGVIEGDDVAIYGGIPTNGDFEDKHQGAGKRVILHDLVLTGRDNANYALKQPYPRGTVTAKTVLPLIPLIEKEYDGTYLIKENIKAEFAPGVIHPDDELSVTISGCTVDNKNIGANRLVTPGTKTVVGNKEGNYIIRDPQTAYATILPCPVVVTVTGEDDLIYDGRPKTLFASYTAHDGDVPKVTVLYNGSPAPPIFAGNYRITARMDDLNYVCRDITGIEELYIAPAKLLKSDVARTVLPGNTQLKTLPLSAFHIHAEEGSAPVSGTYSLGGVVDEHGILNMSDVRLQGNDLVFRANPDAQLGQAATISVLYTPDPNTYDPILAYLVVEIAEEGYTNTILHAPKTVNLGEDIDLENIRLRTVFDSGKPTEDVRVTQAMLTGEYDKFATGEQALGVKNMIVTMPGQPLRKASFNITALDVVTDFMVTPPTKTRYEWMAEKTLDLTGGYIKASMKSQMPTEPVALAPQMLNITNSALERLGTHAVNVSYEKLTKQNSFEIEVVQAKNNVTQPPAVNQPGIIDLPAGIVFTREGGGTVSAANVQLVLTPLDNSDMARIKAEIGKEEAFKDIPLDNIYYLDISLREIGTNNKVTPSMPLRIQLPYPGGTSRNNTFRILHLPSVSETNVYTPEKHENGMRFTVDSTSPFAIGWLKNTATNGNENGGGSNSGSSGGGSSGSGSYSSPAKDRQAAFWQAVLKAIHEAKDKSVIRANARSYDQMPAEVMQAMTKKNVTLVIAWNGGSDIVITKKTAFMPESTREFFPLSLLSDLYPSNPPKTDDPEEGEAWLREQNALDSANSNPNASKSSGSSSSKSSTPKSNPAVVRPSTDAQKQRLIDEFVEKALLASDSNVIDVIAPDVIEDQRAPVTPKTEGFITTSSGVRPAVVRPVITLPEGYNQPGILGLAIFGGVVLMLAGAAVGLYIRRSRMNVDE